MIGEKMNKRKSRKSRNGLRPRPDMPDIPGGNSERDRNKLKNIDNGKGDIF